MNLNLIDRINSVKRCKRCLVTDKCPLTTIDREYVCNHCRDLERGVWTEEKHFRPEADERCRADLDTSLKSARGKGKYDVLVGFSGGKDSTYLIYRLKKDYPHLRILPATIDMGLMSPVAIENVQEVVNKLDVDHVFLKVRLGFYQKFFKHLFEHRPRYGYKAPSYESKCWSEDNRGFCCYCHGFNDGILLRHAFEQRIPLVLTGLSPGQPWYWFYEMPREEIVGQDHTPAFMHQPPFTQEDRDYCWNPLKYPARSEFPRMLFPYHVWKWNADEIRRDIHRAGLISDFKKSSTAVTNCRLNYLMALIDYQVDGYFIMTPYAGKLIRHGMADKEEWSHQFQAVEFMLARVPAMKKKLPFLARLPKFQILKEVEKWLDVDAEGLVQRYRAEKAAEARRAGRELAASRLVGEPRPLSKEAR